MFKQSDTHIAVVLNEYGSFLGLLTLNDIFQAIVGDMPTDTTRPTPRRGQGGRRLGARRDARARRVRRGPRQRRAPRAGDFRTLAGLSSPGSAGSPASPSSSTGAGSASRSP